ncbi:hypothetical protein Dsin_006453 [Dipteronia sinensis]|uniref:AMP-activated protein kinase glycogen-binding domain-containing protein n=1 Tax=Dipteronia sinensis TaxID=43782 RepID=A0AAE0AYK9_9ROSI|nr:hypothetical protein Dsin_006453 [Dipteronia sinensis]
MATLSHSLSYLSFISHKLFLSQNHHRLNWNPPRQHPHRKHLTFTICACLGKKSSRSSGSRKVKSNEELRDEIREFLCSVGLPECHVPSMKELSEHGRSDLANIVRRRGYKLIGELLTSSAKTDFDALNEDKSLAGQDKKVNHDVEEVSSLVEVPSIDNYFGSRNSDSNLISDGHSCIEIESSANSLEEKESYTSNSQNRNVDSIVVEDTSLSTDVSNMKDRSSGSSTYEDLNPDDSILLPIESSSNSFLEETDSFTLKGQHEKENNTAGNVSSSTEVLIRQNYSGSSNSDIAFNLGEHDYMPQTTSTGAALEGKVAKFIQNGDLDMTEDNDNGMSNETAAKESNVVIEGEDAIEVKSRTPGAEHLEHAYDNRVYGAIISNKSALTFKQIDPTVNVNYPLRGDRSAAEGLIGAAFDKDLDVETSKRENQLEVSRLKFMLHQKALELSRLKENIEKEKLALSVLQTKAETEINKAQKLISVKDAELQAAEESLSGLEEVQLQFSGEGEIVEVAGSFNGWHHRIKMDPQPYSSIIESIGSRKSRLWSTVLWLYPGTYEIKFIIDGQWRIDSQKESVTRGGMCNNILRVER